MIPIEIYYVRGSSNLSVDKTYSIVALRMRVFFLYQIMCFHITEIAIDKIRLIQIICNQCYSRCSGGCIVHH